MTDQDTFGSHVWSNKVCQQTVVGIPEVHKSYKEENGAANNDGQSWEFWKTVDDDERVLSKGCKQISKAIEEEN